MFDTNFNKQAKVLQYFLQLVVFFFPFLFISILILILLRLMSIFKITHQFVCSTKHPFLILF